MSLIHGQRGGVVSQKDDLHQENAIGEASKGVHLTVSIGKPGARRPFTHDCSAQTHDKCQAVKEHVDTIAQ